MTEQVSRSAAHKWRITDARGRRVAQLDPVTMHLLRRHDVIEPEVLRDVVGEKGVKITPQERAFLIVGVVALLTIAGLFVREVFVEGLSEAPWAKSSALLYFSFLPWFVWLIIRRSRFDKVKGAMLKHGRCPHCGYDLAGLPVDNPDGATVCPECGCAWMLNQKGEAEGMDDY